jgi:hypothetical protein
MDNLTGNSCCCEKVVVSTCPKCGKLRYRMESDASLTARLGRIEAKGHQHGCILCGIVTRTNGHYIRHHEDDCPLRQYDNAEEPKPAAEEGKHG